MQDQQRQDALQKLHDENERLGLYDAAYKDTPSNVPWVEFVEIACARIKAADDAAAERDYMLDSDDCISVLRGTWKAPVLNDQPTKANGVGKVLMAKTNNTGPSNWPLPASVDIDTLEQENRMLRARNERLTATMESIKRLVEANV